MKTRILILSAAAGALLATGTLFAFQDGAEMPTAKAGAEHKVLERFVGEWSTTFKMAPMAPGMPPVETHGTEKARLAMNGLWVISDYDDPQFMGMGFSGHSVFGYDTEKRKYVGAWVDSMTASITPSEGVWDEAQKTMTLTMMGKDPMTGQPSQQKSVVRFHDDGSRTERMTLKGADGKENEFFTIDYKKRK